jgi:hypothetical protein
MAQTKTKYTGVYKDEKGNFFYQTELGIDKITGKRIRKKGRKDKVGKRFSTAIEAYKELIRVKNEYLENQGYSNYRMTYEQFMENIYIPYYKTTVEKHTFATRKGLFSNMKDRFAKIELRSISLEEVENYRMWLLTDKEDDGAGVSQSYASIVFGAFRKSLDYALKLGYIENNISRQAKAIPKGKAIIPYWTRKEFEAVISKIYIKDVYEHLNFVMLWVYFTTGVRVNEGCALRWADVDFKKKRLRIHNMLILESKTSWYINPYTKTIAGKRIITLDEDTLSILKKWKKAQKSIGLGKDDDFIFSYDGLPMLKSAITRVIERYSKLAGVKRIQIKGLRHSNASYLINEFNVSILILSKRLGHSSPEITLKHYSHLWTAADEKIVEEMEGNIVYKAPKKSLINCKEN